MSSSCMYELVVRASRLNRRGRLSRNRNGLSEKRFKGGPRGPTDLTRESRFTTA